ncbi:MAG: helix-turn-helix domain-containing protein [Pirellulales bacterium]|nr:helix-turn-helix domain-containing protein [Pirellulales bacterium]
MLMFAGEHRPNVAANLRRLMARLNLTNLDVAQRCGLDLRTVKSILAGRRQPHPRTLHRLATGLEVDADELFQTPALLARRYFDRWTNQAVDDVIAAEPQLVVGWTPADFEELYSRFGTGGPLTRDGARQAIQLANQKRKLREKIDLVLETDQADVLCALVETLYNKVLLSPAGEFDAGEPPPGEDGAE